jgi:protein TonB
MLQLNFSNQSRLFLSLNLAVNNATTSHYKLGENTLIWAIIGSMLLHGLLAVVIPNIHLDPIKKPDILEIEFLEKPEAQAEALPEPIQTKPKTIEPKLQTKPEPKPLKTPTIVKNEATPYQPPPTNVAPQTEVIAVTAKPDTPSPIPPVPVASPAPPPPAAPNQAELDDARGRYGNTLWGAIGKHKQYPKLAQMRGWQGEVIVELQLDGNGKLKSKKIIQSSGHDVLDRQALDMVEKAAPFPLPPETLRGNSFSIKVPIPFKLEEQ